jgi:hypothetical protein
MRTAAVVSFDDLRWSETEIPGSNPPVAVARLRVENGTGAYTMLVRFPPGWSRPGAGHYRVHEEIFVVEGDLTVGDETYSTGDYAWLPSGYPRTGSASSGGAVVLARFSGPPVWVPSDGAGEDFHPEDVVREHWQDAEERPSPLGAGRARLLREDRLLSSWVVEAERDDEHARHPTELFSLVERSWAWVDAGQQAPRMARPCFCRVFVEAPQGGPGGAPTDDGCETPATVPKDAAGAESHGSREGTK